MLFQAKVLSTFTCLGDSCADTCCKGWSMQVDEPTHVLYQNEQPQLLAAIEKSSDGASWIMRKMHRAIA